MAGKREGKGIYILVDGYCYEGDWVDGKIDTSRLCAILAEHMSMASEEWWCYQR